MPGLARSPQLVGTQDPADLSKLPATLDDALLGMALCSEAVLRDGGVVLPYDGADRDRYEEANGALAAQGMRVMAIGIEDFPAKGFAAAQDPKEMLDRIVLVALVGIVDSPRPEARQSIEECRNAGIRVRILTGLAAGVLVLLVEMDVWHGLFATTDLTSGPCRHPPDQLAAGPR